MPALISPLLVLPVLNKKPNSAEIVNVDFSSSTASSAKAYWPVKGNKSSAAAAILVFMFILKK